MLEHMTDTSVADPAASHLPYRPIILQQPGPMQ